MKNRLILSAAANVLAIILAIALPAGAGVSLDRMSPSTNVACGANPAQVFNLVPPGGGCDAAGFPMLEVAPPALGLGAADNIDGLSTNTFTSPKLSYYLVFSGERASLGQVGTPYNGEAANNQAASDLWRTLLTGGSPAAAMGACAPTAVPPPHFLHRNQTAFNLIPTAAVGALVLAPQDDIDAVELDVLDITGDNVHDFDVYFSLDATSPSRVFSGADIYFAPAGAAFILFSPPAQVGLLVGDEIDALVMWDRGAIGAPDPGLDLALFSLAPGSPSLGGASPAAIFVTDFNFGFCTYVPANQLGLVVTDNVDGLDVIP